MAIATMITAERRIGSEREAAISFENGHDSGAATQRISGICRQLHGPQASYLWTQFIRSCPTTFAPVERIPVTDDYRIGPGDEILIRAWDRLT